MRTIVMLITLLAAAHPFDAAAQERRPPTSPSESPLVAAIRAGDAAAVRRLLEAGADPDAVIPIGGHGWDTSTPLGIALSA